MISATVVCDSIHQGARITSMVLVYPRFILAELNTHRALSRSSASSRAIPVEKMIERVANDPAMPVHWGANRPGMQAREELDAYTIEGAKNQWAKARQWSTHIAASLVRLGLHKQVANRILEPWMHATTIVTATEWDNFYHLRCHEDAQPEFRVLAEAMLAAHNASTPRRTNRHLPFLRDDEFEPLDAALVSAARCARVSYLNHDQSTPDWTKDVALAMKLKASGHMSPFEHPSWASPGNHANFVGWRQYRKDMPGECVTHFPRLKRHT